MIVVLCVVVVHLGDFFEQSRCPRPFQASCFGKGAIFQSFVPLECAAIRWISRCDPPFIEDAVHQATFKITAFHTLDDFSNRRTRPRTVRVSRSMGKYLPDMHVANFFPSSFG